VTNNLEKKYTTNFPKSKMVGKKSGSHLKKIVLPEGGKTVANPAAPRLETEGTEGPNNTYVRINHEPKNSNKARRVRRV